MAKKLCLFVWEFPKNCINASFVGSAHQNNEDECQITGFIIQKFWFEIHLNCKLQIMMDQFVDLSTMCHLTPNPLEIVRIYTKCLICL